VVANGSEPDSADSGESESEPDTPAPVAAATIGRPFTLKEKIQILDKYKELGTFCMS
jgi:hypothetical protein